MKLSLQPAFAAAAAMMLVSPALAQTPPGAATAAKPLSAKPVSARHTGPRGPAKPRSEKSIACSKDADGKNLHGAARNSFMRGCKK